MNVLFTQSCDPKIYTRLITYTMPTIVEYCEKWNCSFDFFIGLKRGARPWHAALNRISVLKNLVDQNYDGWVVHVDADAFVFDMEFDIRAFLQERKKFCLIATPSGIQPPRWWDINNGVFIIDLGSAYGVEIVNAWHNQLAAIDEDRLRGEEKWGDVVNDQTLMHLILEDRPYLQPLVLHDSDNLNGGSRFIRQIMRADGDMEKRAKTIAHMIAHRRNSSADNRERDTFYGDLVGSIYRVMFDREPDPEGYKSALEGLTAGRSIEEELRSCVASPEFKANLDRLSRIPTD